MNLNTYLDQLEGVLQACPVEIPALVVYPVKTRVHIRD